MATPGPFWSGRQLVEKGRQKATFFDKLSTTSRRSCFLCDKLNPMLGDSFSQQFTNFSQIFILFSHKAEMNTYLFF